MVFLLGLAGCDADVDTGGSGAGGAATSSATSGSTTTSSAATTTTGAGAGVGGTASSGGAPPMLAVGDLVADFSLLDVNPTSSTANQAVSPRDYLQRVSGWYFGHST